MMSDQHENQEIEQDFLVIVEAGLLVKSDGAFFVVNPDDPELVVPLTAKGRQVIERPIAEGRIKEV